MPLYSEVHTVPKWLEFVLGLIVGLGPIAVTFLIKIVTCKRTTDFKLKKYSKEEPKYEDQRHRNN